MKNKKIYGILFGLGSFALLGNIIYRLVMSLGIGLFEVLFASLFLILFLFTLTWGSREKKDGILANEELGKKIENKSTRLSYHVLLFTLVVGLIIDRVVTGTANLSLIIILGIALVLPAILTFVIAQTYQITHNIIGKTTEWLVEKNAEISTRVKNRILFTFSMLTTLFIISPLFNESRSYYDFLVYLFGEPAETGFNPFPLLFSAVILFLIVNTLSQVLKAVDDDNSHHQ